MISKLAKTPQRIVGRNPSLDQELAEQERSYQNLFLQNLRRDGMFFQKFSCNQCGAACVLRGLRALYLQVNTALVYIKAFATPTMN